MKGLTPKERVELSLNHREPDKVPVALGGSGQMIADVTTKRLVERLNLPREGLERVFSGFRYVYFSEELWGAFSVDTRYIHWNHEKQFNLEIQEEGNKYINDWGVDLDFSGGTFSSALHLQRTPLKDASIDDITEYDWPRPTMKEEKKRQLRNRAKFYLGKGLSVFAYRPVLGGVFSMARFLRGTEQFYKDLIKNKDFVRALLDKTVRTQWEYYRLLLDSVGEYIQVVEIEDDLGSQERSLISPEIYRELIKPRHESLVSLIKDKNPDVKIMIHSDGAVRQLIPDFLDLGIDILNPIQTNCMDLRELKEDFGSEIVFQGGIDVQSILSQKEPKEVADEVKRVFDILAPGGGYIASTSHNLTNDVPVDNIIMMFDCFQKFGEYT